MGPVFCFLKLVSFSAEERTPQLQLSISSFHIYCDTGTDIAAVVFQKLSGVLEFRIRSYSYVTFLLWHPRLIKNLLTWTALPLFIGHEPRGVE